MLYPKDARGSLAQLTNICRDYIASYESVKGHPPSHVSVDTASWMTFQEFGITEVDGIPIQKAPAIRG
jgi:hypothetical protein